jgi:small subunit ribosomal protein S4e
MFLIDGNVCTDYRRPVGLMDVLSIPKTNEHFRILLDSRGKLRVVKIDEASAKWKLGRIEGKTTIKNGKIQLHLHDSRNILLSNDKYKTGDVLKIEIPSQKVIDCYTLSPGNIAMLIGGKHKGELASIVNYEVTKNPKPNIIQFENFSTTKNNVFIVGTKTPEITPPEVAIV